MDKNELTRHGGHAFIESPYNTEAEKWLSGKPKTIKNSVDLQAAKKFRIAIEKTGAKCQILKNSNGERTAPVLLNNESNKFKNASSGGDLVVQRASNLVIDSSRRSDEKYCASCGKVLHMSADFCPSCGAKQTAHTSVAPQPNSQSVKGMDQKYCASCASVMHQSATQCPKCGATQASHGSINSKSKVAGALLAFFLGGLGAHKFYFGRIGLGLLYLAFCWTGIPAIVALIEGIYYLTMSDEKFYFRAQAGTL